MDADSRKKIEMGTSSLVFTNAHPVTEPGMAAVAVKLGQLVTRANELAAVQRDGLIHTRAASARKIELRRAMLAVPIPHLAQVGAAAAREEHELGQAFRFKPTAGTFLAFRTAARGMAAAAEAHKETLAKYGLALSVVEEFGRMLDEFDAAVELGNDGRTAHLGATRELKAVAQEIVRTVRVMDGPNRQRFADDGQLLGAWLGASRVLGRRRGGTAAAAPAGAVPAGAAPADPEVPVTAPTDEARPAA